MFLFYTFGVLLLVASKLYKRNQKEFERLMQGVSYGLIGCVSKSRDFKVYGLDGRPCIETDIYDLKEAWQRSLRW